MLSFESPILFGRSMDETVHLRGFAAPEDEFVWSNGRWCEVVFDLDLGRPMRGRSVAEFLVDLDAFKVPPSFPGQNVLVYLNGARVQSALVTGRSMLSFGTRANTLLAQGNVLTFDLPDAVRPTTFGLEDERMLGVQLFSLAIQLDS